MNFRLLIILSICWLTFVNCGSDQSSHSDEPVKTLPWSGDVNSVPKILQQKNPIASIDAVKGGTVKIYANQYPKSLNFYLDQMSTTAQIFTSLFEPLLAYHPVTLENIPHLAKLWEISKDKKSFTFTIDENAKWSDGKPITADDVLFTYNTIMDKKNNTARFRIGLSRFEAPKKLGTYKIQFTQKEIHWDNFNTIATGLYILPKHYFENKDFNKENNYFPITSGPYKLDETKKGRYVKLIRNGEYWQRAYPFAQGKYNFDRIYFKVYNEENLAYQAFKKGDMDFYPVYVAYLWAEDTKGEKFDNNWIVKQRIYNHKPIGFQGWAFNMRKEIFKDNRVRKALAHLVNRSLMIEKLAYNEYKSTDSYFPDFYMDENENPNEKIDFSLDKAKKLLTEAGWKVNQKGKLEKNGELFQFTIIDRSKSTEKYFTIFIEQAKKLGIEAKIETTDLAAWSSKMDKYDFEMTWASWGGGVFKDPEPQWYSLYANEPGQPNITGFQSKEVDRLIETQKTEFSVAKRNEIVKKIDILIHKENPYILLWHLDNTRLLYWNKFSYPKDPLGKFGDESYALDYWWYDKTKDEKLTRAIDNKSKLEDYTKIFKWKD